MAKDGAPLELEVAREGAGREHHPGHAAAGAAIPTWGLQLEAA
jgi:hypothetical protein